MQRTLVGKNADFLGDSITYGYGLDDLVSERFTNLIKNDLSLNEANNYGLSATKIARVGKETNNFANRFVNMSSNKDIVFVFGGTNDYGHTLENARGTAPFGTFADRTESTFYGALHVLYQCLVVKYIGKQIVAVTPIYRQAPIGLTGDDYTVNLDTNKNLRDYVNGTREVAEYYGILVLDLFKDFTMNPNVEIVKTTYMPDGLHPNAVGHRKIANAFINFMEHLEV